MATVTALHIYHCSESIGRRRKYRIIGQTDKPGRLAEPLAPLRVYVVHMVLERMFFLYSAFSFSLSLSFRKSYTKKFKEHHVKLKFDVKLK